jgi:hypothetical protein
MLYSPPPNGGGSLNDVIKIISRVMKTYEVSNTQYLPVGWLVLT